MRFCYLGKDGGPASTVSGFWLIEIKSLFSICLLKFSPGSREAFHTHAFHALSWFVKEHVTEYIMDEETGRITQRDWTPSFKPKLTKKNHLHKVYSHDTTWCFTIRGPWSKYWKEFRPTSSELVTLTHGRQEVLTEKMFYPILDKSRDTQGFGSTGVD